jgi:hypothetical protein
MIIYTEKKAQLVAYKGGKCHDCGGVFPQCCFDFDHRDCFEKSFAISYKMTAPIAELMVEADKCDLVCANCHRIRTANDPNRIKKILSNRKPRMVWNKGRKCSQISARMIGNTNGRGGKGKVISEAQKEQISQTNRLKGIHPSVEACSKGGKVRQGVFSG